MGNLNPKSYHKKGITVKILVINPILFTADNGIIPQVQSIKDTMIHSLCQGFCNIGHDVTLVTMADYKPAVKENYNFTIHFFASDLHKCCPPDILPSSMEMYRFIKRHHCEFDMILASETFQITTLYAAVLCPEKTIIWQELTAHQRKMHRLPSKIWHNVVVPILMSKIRTIVPRSPKAYDFIKKYSEAAVSTIVDHGVDVSKFIPSDKKQRYIISSSQLIKRKNVGNIIAKFARLHELPQYSDIKLIIAGRGEEEMNLKEEVSRLGLVSHVNFVGFLPQAELNRYIRESLCFLVDTLKDINVVSIPEAIASGTPVLTNSIPATSHYIDEFSLGIVKDGWDVNELCSIIDNNAMYVKNCISYIPRLTNDYKATQLVDAFLSSK